MSSSPVFAFVTQGKTEHMVTIVDPTILKKLKQADGFSLSKLKQDSEILIKWQSTGGEETVIVSSIRLVEDGGGRGGRRSSLRSSISITPSKPTAVSKSSSTTTAPSSSKKPGWQIELEAHNGQPTSASSTSKSRRNSRVSTQAAATTEASGVAAATTKNEDISVRRISATTSSAATIKKKDKDKSKTIPVKKTTHAKHKQTYSATTTTSVVLPAPKNAPMMSTAPPTSTVGQNNPIVNPLMTAMEKKMKKGRIRKPRRVIPEVKDYIPEEEQPAPADVVGGRGGRSNHHPGNRPYWRLILENRTRYKNCRSDHDKAHIANEILMYVQHSLGGRFVNIDSGNKRWFILPDAVVLDKIKQALRDKYVPYWAKDAKKNANSNGATLTMKAMGNKRNVTQGAAMAAVNANNAAANPNNNLGFLFNSPANQPGQASALPTVDDILKAKVDQMPTFNGTVNGAFPSRASFGLNPYHQSMFPNAWMASMGMGNYMGMGGTSGAMSGAMGVGGVGGAGASSGDMSNGFGFGGNPGAPALPTGAMAGFSPSLGLMQGMDMKSLDNYMEHQVAAGMAMGMPPAAAAQMANAQSLGIVPPADANNTQAKGKKNPAETPTASSTGSKTDWGAMYANALSNSKPV